MDEVKMSFGICEKCGNPICVLDGGYLSPENIKALGLCQLAEYPALGVRVHEFLDLEEAKRRYGPWLNDPLLKPGMLKDYAIIRRRTKTQN